MSVEGVKGVLEGTLNESVLTPNSIYGIVMSKLGCQHLS